MPSLTHSSYRPSSYTRRPAWMPSSYVPGYSNPYMNNPPPPQPNPSQQQHQLQTQQIFIPNDLVGCIIGKGGSKINEIRHMSASQIKIMEPGATSTGVNGGPAPTGGEGERLVVITGPPANIQMAVQLLYHVRDTMLVLPRHAAHTRPTAPRARETEANPSRIECMNSLRIECTNGHPFARVLFSFPLFAYCSLFSYVFFFFSSRLNSRRSIRTASLIRTFPSVVIVAQWNEPVATYGRQKALAVPPPWASA